MNQILEIKIIKGESLITKLGTNMQVNKSGVKILTFAYLKNSTSSNKFKIIPKQ
tara:strand:+ start:236 stop:397 length:162 start_codon:yes stop_codon:yes gene_type:complete